MADWIITASDSGYYHLLSDLLASLDWATGGDCPPVGVMDLGLEPWQRTALERRGVTLVTPDWPAGLPNLEGQKRTYLAQIARPWLPELFPKAQRLIWLDADCWVQDAQVLGWLLQSCEHGRLAVAAELHPSYWKHYTHSGLHAKWGVYDRFFGTAEAELTGFTPAINVGVFALRADAPHWQPWRDTMKRVLAVEPVFCAEQLALDHVVMSQGLPSCWLPARANWVCHLARPFWSHGQGRLLEPTPPYDPLWVVHLVMRTKAMELELPAIDGPPVTTALTFPAVRGLTGG